MRLVTLRRAEGTRAGIAEDDRILELDLTSAREALRNRETLIRHLTGRSFLTADCDLAPVVPDPGKIVCVGRNYRDHRAEMAAPDELYPTIFAKFSEALIGPNDSIEMPPESAMVDWEVELAVVIGTVVRRANPKEARQAIAGFTVINDVTARDWARRTSQWLQGKTFQSTCPLGPALVTPDEIDASNLAISCSVDGVVKQAANTADMMFTPVDLIEYVSRIVTLQPGDVIATGTPGGVGWARKPPEFLSDGQILRSSIEGIGELVNVCRQRDLASVA